MAKRAFKKTYLYLSSIKAYGLNIALDFFTYNKASLKQSLQNFLNRYEKTQDERQNSCSDIFNSTSHCDCFFKRKTALAVRLFKYIPRCPFYCTFFAFRRTGVHPPFFAF